MKKIELKEVEIEEPVEIETLDYKKHIMALLLIPLDPAAGTNYEEMAIVLPIYQKFKAAEKNILLENQEHEEVVKRLKNAQFRQNTPELFEMIQSVIDAPDCEIG